jgi:hypothetical protein
MNVFLVGHLHLDARRKQRGCVKSTQRTHPWHQTNHVLEFRSQRVDLVVRLPDKGRLLVPASGLVPALARACAGDHVAIAFQRLRTGSVCARHLALQLGASIIYWSSVGPFLAGLGRMSTASAGTIPTSRTAKAWVRAFVCGACWCL